MEEAVDPRKFLMFGLQHYQIEVVQVEGKFISLEHGYLIEHEGGSLFKLMHQGQVIAPFGEVETLCEFIKQDIQLNYD